MKIGYARVSTADQNLDNQIEALNEFGCEKVFQQKLSGKSADNREQLQQALEFVREGDVLVITKLDRMARSVLDLNIIAKRLLDKQVDLKVLTQDIDTTTIYGKLVFNVLGAVAQFERELINERAKEGIIKAKARGVKFGRSKKVNAEMAPNQPQAAVQSVVGHYSISSVLHPSDSYDLLIYLCYRMAH